MSTQLDTFHPSFAHAAQFIRRKYSLWELQYTVVPDFEQEFNCRVIYDRGIPIKVVFNTEQELLLFVLRFSNGE